ncbi:MAG: YigZ family protein [Firmicutes bacterium]|nr:YigZ family protein [Bacillota bacterium]
MQLPEYLSVAGPGSDLIVVKRSKFIGHAAPAESEAEAMEFIAKISDEHKTATHNVWAYQIGEQDQWQRYSDDGEPSGTAGVPTLEVLKQMGLKNTVVVVTRYFGGTLLGASGLVRAYSRGAKVGIEAAGVVRKVLHNRIQITVDYSTSGKMENELHGYDQLILEPVSYTDRVTFSGLVPPARLGGLETLVQELTGGQSHVEVLGSEYVDFPV